MQETHNETVEKIIDLVRCIQTPPPMNQQGMRQHYDKILLKLYWAHKRIEYLQENMEMLKSKWAELE
jgi:hypothetical protein